jgi:hypothetical protein
MMVRCFVLIWRKIGGKMAGKNYHPAWSMNGKGRRIAQIGEPGTIGLKYLFRYCQLGVQIILGNPAYKEDS